MKKKEGIGIWVLTPTIIDFFQNFNELTMLEPKII
jgi:hypothetical protein